MKAQQRSGGGGGHQNSQNFNRGSLPAGLPPPASPPLFYSSRCCYKHDCCYEGLHSKQCHPYIDHYRYLIINDDVICEYRNNSHCAVLACECDRHAALCFRKYAKTYNKKYHRYPYVLCKETTPKCRGSKKPK
ncbi:basic phospholipase A2 PLA-B-like [Podarcis lilfordi]|uniref:Phospholipase A2 n=1 Tax=Podarcis lilfordi TaxID=74358 RepID=A0AA35KQR6_9SAUR|nr:basic phospholipase A2 PLA-B-like [Podarcis lilfordi]